MVSNPLQEIIRFIFDLKSFINVPLLEVTLYRGESFCIYSGGVGYEMGHHRLFIAVNFGLSV